jgi:uncharacterized protein YbcI
MDASLAWAFAACSPPDAWAYTSESSLNGVAFMPADTVNLRGGELNAALTSAAVGIYRMHLGRGPTSACTLHHDDVVTVVMREVMTPAERTLAQSGSRHDVTNMRRLFQATMETDFRVAVERLTDRKVVAFISANNVDLDVAVETFILDAPLERS